MRVSWCTRVALPCLAHGARCHCCHQKGRSEDSGLLHKWYLAIARTMGWFGLLNHEAKKANSDPCFSLTMGTGHFQPRLMLVTGGQGQPGDLRGCHLPVPVPRHWTSCEVSP